MTLILVIGLLAACSNGSDDPVIGDSGSLTIPPGSTDSTDETNVSGDENGEDSSASLTPLRTHVNIPISEPDTLDPHDGTQVAGNTIKAQIFERLYVVGIGINEPRLATSYDVSDDGLIWTYHLRHGVVFSDGSPFTSKDVLFSYDKALSHLGNAIFVSMIEEVSALDDYTIQFTLSSPHAAFHGLVSTVLIASESATLAAGDDAPFNPIGTGAFMLEKETFNITQSITLVRNPLYWGDEDIQIETATFHVIVDELTLLNAFEAGELDYIYVPPQYWANLRDSGLYNVYSGPTYTTHYVIFNNQVPPFDDVRVRQAFSWAIDRDLVVELASEGVAVPAVSAAPVDIVNGASIPDEYYTYNPEKAREMFEELGITDLGSFKIIAGPAQRGAEVIQQNLADVGVKVELELTEIAAYQADLLRGNFTVAVNAISLFGDFFGYELLYSSGSIFNFARYNNPEVDELFQIAVGMMDMDERSAIYNRIINIISQDAPNYYFAYDVFTVATQLNLLYPDGGGGGINLKRFTWVE
jgi:peptide/nickel transport system substrate-binding protein